MFFAARYDVAILPDFPGSISRIDSQSSVVMYELPLCEGMVNARYRVIHERERTVNSAAGKIQNRVKNEK